MLAPAQMTGFSSARIAPVRLRTLPILRVGLPGWRKRGDTVRALVRWYLGGSGPAVAPLQLRPGGRAVTLTDRNEARFALATLYLVRRFSSPDPSATVAEVIDVQKWVRARLATAYPTGRSEGGAGYPGPKAKDALLYLLVRATRPDFVVETGVDQGVSSTFFLEAMRRNDRGTLLSIDIGAPTETGRPVGWVVPPELRRRWELRLGPAERLLPEVDGSPDVFLHDSLHSYDHMTFEFGWADERLAPGALLVSDDIDLNGAYADFLRGRRGRWRSLSNATVGVAQRVTA
jgi:predicted O-methyltransferase YrrM